MHIRGIDGVKVGDTYPLGRLSSKSRFVRILFGMSRAVILLSVFPPTESFPSQRRERDQKKSIQNLKPF